jgi:membrane-associated progesterone receptor component
MMANFNTPFLTMMARGAQTYLKLGPPNPEAQTGTTPDTNISVQELQGHNGRDPDKPIYMAIKGEDRSGRSFDLTFYILVGIVFDVSADPNFGRDGLFNIYTGKDASRALGMLSMQPEDLVSGWETLTNSEKRVLDDWVTVFECVLPFVKYMCPIVRLCIFSENVSLS